MARSISTTVLTTLLMLFTNSVAHAHTGAGGPIGLYQGIGHPFGGLDHVLAMVALGLFAAQLGRNALWLVPASFLTMMAFGGIAAVAGLELPFVELGIAASVILLGATVAFNLNLPVLAAMGLAGFAATFHGYAHGAEMPVGSSPYGYALGFMISTAILHSIGIGFGLGLKSPAMQRRQRFAVEVAGAGMALAGFAILGGSLMAPSPGGPVFRSLHIAARSCLRPILGSPIASPISG